MKHIVSVFALSLLSVLSFGQGVNGLIAHWNFSGNASDITGHGLNGTMTGTTPCAGYNGIPNTGLRFNGTSDRIVVPYNNIMNVDSFSICALIKVEGFNSAPCQGSYIFNRGGYPDADDLDLEFNDNEYDLSCGTYSPTQNRFAERSHGSSSYTTNAVWNVGPAITDSTWYCVVVTYDGVVAKSFVNGVIKDSLPWPDGFASTTNPIGIGYNAKGYPGAPYYFKGVIDDIRLYNRALSISEITQYCDTSRMADVVANVNVSAFTPSLCVGNSFNLPYSVTGPFNAGNVFTAQLSDASGVFGSPTSIGSATSVSSGIIICTVPSSTPAGSHYRVRIIASNPGGISADNGTDITIKTFTVPAVTTNSPVCVGNTLIVTTVDTQSGVTYSWAGPHSYTAATQNFSIPNAQSVDSGLFRLTVVTPNGCRDTVFVTGSIIPAGSALGVSITANPGDLICFNFPVTFTAVATIGGVTYQWAVNGVNVPGATSNTYTTTGLIDGDVVTCVVTAGSACLSPNAATSNAIVVHVSTGISVVIGSIIMTPSHFTAGVNETFSVNVFGYPPSDFTYQWRKNTVNIPGATTNPYVTNSLSASDKITVMIKSKLPCSNPDSVLSNSYSLGIESMHITAGNIILYPNPNKGGFSVTGTQLNGSSVAVEVLNVTGQVVYSNEVALKNSSFSININIDNIITGMYFLRVRSGDENKVLRFIIAN